jgi:hypothetical protein
MELTERLANQEGGYVGIACADLARFTAFDVSWDQVKLPPNTAFRRFPGLSVAANYNAAVRAMIEADKAWLWIMDNDHVFPPDILINLLERDVDIVTPLYLRRRFPFLPVLHGDETRRYTRYNFSYLKGKSGLVDMTADGTLPTGGMLIRRHVLETMPDPWFETGQIDSEYGSWDIYFTEKARKAGFSLHLDTDNAMAHIVPLALYPKRDEQGNWGYEIREAM